MFGVPDMWRRSEINDVGFYSDKYRTKTLNKYNHSGGWYVFKALVV